MGSRGGTATARSRTPEERQAAARKASKGRMKKMSKEDRKRVAALGGKARWHKNSARMKPSPAL
jgi:hypothetical protein